MGYQSYAEQHGSSYARSFELMCDLLPDEALTELFETGRIIIQKKNRRYVIYECGVVQGWCVHPVGGVPVFDTIAVMYLMIIHHEAKFRFVANRIH